MRDVQDGCGHGPFGGRRRRSPGRGGGRAVVVAAVATVCGWGGAGTPGGGPGVARAADVASAWFGGTGNWGDAANWQNTPAVRFFPNEGNGGRSYAAAVGGGAATLDRPITVRDLSLGEGATLSGPSDLTVTGEFRFDGGLLAGAGTTTVAAGGALVLSRGLVRVDGRTFVNRGAATSANSATLYLAGNAVFDNVGSFGVLADGAAVATAGQGGGTFHNAGTFAKSGGPGVASVSAAFDNDGTVAARSGTLRFFGGGSHGGRFEVSAGAALDFAFGFAPNAFAPASSVSGAGDVAFAATASVGGAYAVAGTTTVDGTVAFAGPATLGRLVVGTSPTAGTARFDGPAAVGSLDLQGRLGGTGRVDVTGALGWTAGAMSGAGTTRVSGALAMTGGGQKVLDGGRVLEVAGSAVWDPAGQGAAVLGCVGGPTIRTLAGATFEARGDTTVLAVTSGGSAPFRFDNAGAFTKSAGGTTDLRGSTFNNAGTVRVAGGTLLLGGFPVVGGDGGGHHTGPFVVAAGATLAIDGRGAVQTFDAGSSVTGAGTIRVSGEASIVGSPPIDSTGRLAFDDGSVVGTGTIDARGTLSFTGNYSNELTGPTLNNHGTATWGGPAVLGFSGSATLNNLAGATFAAVGPTTSLRFTGPAPAFNNAGTFTRSGDGATAFENVPFNNDGTVEVAAGTLRLAGGGTSRGAFRVAAGAALELAPILNSDTSLSLAAGSTVTGAGQLRVTGEAALAGTADVGQAFVGVAPARATVAPGGVLAAGRLTTAGGEVRLAAGPAAAPGRLVLRGDWDHLGPSNFFLNGQADSAGAAAGVLDLAGGTRQVNVVAGTVFAYARIANGALAKSGDGTLVLLGPNAFAGPVVVSGGTLEVSADAHLGDPSNNLVLAGGALRANGTFATGRSVALGRAGNGAGTVDVGASVRLTLNAPVSGDTDLIKVGAGQLLTGAANPYAGATRVSAGKLTVLPGGSIDRSYLVSVAAGATLEFDGGDKVVRALAGAGAVTLDGGASLTVADDGSATTFGGVVAGDGRLAKAGPGTLTLAGDNAFAGGLRVGDGTVVLAGPASFGGGVAVAGPTAVVSAGADAHLGAAANGVTLTAGGTLRATGSFATARTVAVGAGGGTVRADAGATLTVGGPVSGTGPLAKAGPGTLRLTAASPLAAAVTVREGTLTLAGPAGALPSATAFALANGATLRLDNAAGGGETNADRLADAAPLTITGGGALRLAGPDGGAAAEHLGLLTVASGAAVVDLDPGSGPGSTAALYLAGVRVATRRVGAVTLPAGAVDFRGPGLGTTAFAFLADGLLPAGATADGGPAKYLAAYGVVPAGFVAPSGLAAGGAAGVPEPTAGTAGLAAALGMLARWRRRRACRCRARARCGRG